MPAPILIQWSLNQLDHEQLIIRLAVKQAFLSSSPPMAAQFYSEQHCLTVLTIATTRWTTATDMPMIGGAVQPWGAQSNEIVWGWNRRFFHALSAPVQIVSVAWASFVMQDLWKIINNGLQGILGNKAPPALFTWNAVPILGFHCPHCMTPENQYHSNWTETTKRFWFCMLGEHPASEWPSPKDNFEGCSIANHLPQTQHSAEMRVPIFWLPISQGGCKSTGLVC